jgi:hypothetical protein
MTTNAPNYIRPGVPLTQATGAMLNPYSIGARNMAAGRKDFDSVTWDSFKWVVGGLLGVVVVLLGLIFTGFKTDLSEIRTKFDGLTTEVHQNHVETAKGIAAIGGKLDQLIADGRQRPR